MTTLACDFGARFGWAMRDGAGAGAGPITSGTWALRGERSGQRLLDLWRHLKAIPSVHRVVYEDVRRHMGTDAAHAYGAILGIVQVWAENRFIPCDGVGVTSIKMHATGRGKADKQQMMAAATARGWSFTDDNEADALWILDYCTGGPSAVVPVRAKTKRAKPVRSGDAPVSATPDHPHPDADQPGGRQGVDDREPGSPG